MSNANKDFIESLHVKPFVKLLVWQFYPNYLFLGLPLYALCLDHPHLLPLVHAPSLHLARARIINLLKSCLKQMLEEFDGT